MPPQNTLIRSVSSKLLRLSDLSEMMSPREAISLFIQALREYISLYNSRVLLNVTNLLLISKYQPTFEGLIRYILVHKSWTDLTHPAVIKSLELLGNSYQLQINRFIRFSTLIELPIEDLYNYQSTIHALLLTCPRFLFAGYGHSREAVLSQLDHMYALARAS